MARLDLRDRLAPKWLIFTLDVAIVLAALTLSYLLRFDFDIPEVELDLLGQSIFLFLAIRIIGFIFGRTFAGIIRFTSTEDAARIFRVTFLSSAVLYLLGLLRYSAIDETYFLPRSILILEFFLTTFSLIAYRIFFKLWYLERVKSTHPMKKAIIYGAGEAGTITKRTLDRDAASRLSVIAFIDDDSKKSGKKLEGVPIRSTDELSGLLEKEEVDQLIISIMKPEREQRQRVVDIAFNHGVEVLDVPPVSDWIKGTLSYRQLRSIELSDLMGREEIQLDEDAINRSIKGRVVLVTGAAGSIGSELVRQILSFNPATLILLDRAESDLHDIYLETQSMEVDSKIIPMLCDICDKVRIETIMSSERVDTLYHAAAYKHVPLLEGNVREAVWNNINGTMTIANAAAKHGVDRFVFISTDKAVNPTNVMGATKRAAELYVQSKEGSTRFITTRFGNVLGSKGSVIPRFKSQIENGGPLTVTHPDIERFFMTIPEAGRLVLEAAAMGEGGEIFLFDMGEPVKIKELADKMIQLSGLEPGKDIEVIFTGLRPGEKIKEEVLTDNERDLPTHNPRILKAKSPPRNHAEVALMLDQVLEYKEQPMEAIACLKELIPEYRSNNSPYEILDK